MHTRHAHSLALLAAALMAGCSSVPPGNAQLDQARSALGAARSDPATVRLADAELQRATSALALASDAAERGDDATQVTHLAYLATQQVTLARETASRRTSESLVAESTVLQSQLRLDARSREVETARLQAEMAQNAANWSRTQAEGARQQTQEARIDTSVAQQQAMAARQQAQALQDQATRTQTKNTQLEAQIRDMEAKATARGLVVTVGDVWFDTGKSELKPGSARHVDKLVAFMKDHPERTALIEGFTDSTGTASFNEALSGRRADSVRMAMLAQGVGSDRVASVGYGELFPVAGNDSNAGRQLNRRVEIVLSNGGTAIQRR